MIGPRFVTLLACLLLLAVPGPPARAQGELAPPRPTYEEVAALKREANAHPKDAKAWSRYAGALIARDGIEERQNAVRALKRAIALSPEDVELRLTLADVYYRQGYFTLSRRQLQAALEHDQGSGPAYARLGRLAMRDWRKYQRRGSLEVARRYWQDGARRAPQDPDPWLGLGILALLDRDPASVFAAGRQVLALTGKLPDRTRGEALLLLGAGAYGLGWAQVSDSAFTAALPWLTGPIREHLTDITPAASDADTAQYHALFDSGQRAKFLDRFWRSRDPDLTTPWNEAHLEFMSRATTAYFLYFDARRKAWDERGWYLVRYGLPEFTEYNPPLITGEYGSLTPTTTNRLLWHYASLGFSVYLEDRYLGEFYDIPISTASLVDFGPDPETLARREAEGSLIAAGRGVFSSVMPGQTRLAGSARVGQFRRVAGFDPRASAAPVGSAAAAASLTGFAPASGRVEAWLSVEGIESTAALSGEAVVYQESTYVELARVKMSTPALCQSDSVAVMQFNFDLPPGGYVIGLSARDSALHATGAWKVPVFVIPALPGRLEVSDLELACGVDQGRRNTPFAKTDYSVYPNPRHRAPRDQPFGFYFEIYNLIPDEAGTAQVSIEYEIRSTRKDKRPFFIKAVNPRRNDPVVNVARVDDVPGRARFQYVSANLSAQPPGPFRIDVTVTDLANSFAVRKSLDFELIP